MGRGAALEFTGERFDIMFVRHWRQNALQLPRPYSPPAGNTDACFANLVLPHPTRTDHRSRRRLEGSTEPAIPGTRSTASGRR
jgi:hypothetical protein